MLNVIRQWVIKTMMKSKGQTGVVQTLPKKELIELNTQITAQRLMQNGIDPEALKNADQVENVIRRLESRPTTEGVTATKSAKIMDMEGKEIDPKSKIMGGKAIDDDLPPSGIGKNFDDMVKEVLTLKKLEKGNKEGIARIRARQKMLDDAIDNASPGFAGDRKYDAQLVADDLAEKRFGKDFYDLDQRQQMDLYDEAYTGLSKQRFDQKQVQRESLEDFVDDAGGVNPDDPRGIDDFIPDPEDMATGGRAGFSKGSGLKTLFDFLNKKSPAKAYMDYLESIKTRMKAGKEAEVAGEVIPIAAGGALITNQLKKKLKAMNEEQKKEFKKDMEKKADGGRAGFAEGTNYFTNPDNLKMSDKDLRYLKSLSPAMQKAFLKRLDIRNMTMQADGGRIGYDNGSKLTDFIDIQASGSKSGKQQIEGAPEGITRDEESINAIIKADIPITQKIDLLAKYQYGKGRTRIERDGQELFLDEGGAKSRDIGFGFNKDGEGIGGTLMYNMETGDPEFNIGFKKSFADGGRIGYFMGGPNPKGLGLLRQVLNYMSKKGVKEDRFKGVDLSGVDMLRLSNPKRFNKMLEDVRGKVNIREGIMGTDTVRAQQEALRAQRKGLTEKSLDVAKAMKADDDKIKIRLAKEAETTIIPQVKKSLMEGMGMSEEAAEKAARDMAEVAQNIKPIDAPPEITKEGILQLENVLKNMETGGKKKRDLNATGGRIGFKDGMNRRTFLKLLGGLASIPIIGKIVKPLKTVKGVKNVPIIKTENVAGKPEWFDQLVNKVIIEGDDVTKKLATVEREIVHTKKINDTDEVTVYQDLNTDSVRVEYRSPDNMMEEPVDLSYKRTPPDEGSPKASSEFEVTESGFVGRADGPDDYFIDAEEVGGQSIKDLDSDVSKLKQYATGKGPTMKEIVEIKKRKDKVKKLNEGDLDAQSDYITARQGDAYDYDDYASGGIARMLGE